MSIESFSIIFVSFCNSYIFWAYNLMSSVYCKWFTISLFCFWFLILRPYSVPLKRFESRFKSVQNHKAPNTSLSNIPVFIFMISVTLFVDDDCKLIVVFQFTISTSSVVFFKMPYCNLSSMCRVFVDLYLPVVLLSGILLIVHCSLQLWPPWFPTSFLLCEMYVYFLW